MSARTGADRRPSISDLVFLAVVNLVALMALILLTGHVLDRVNLTHDRLDQIQQHVTDQHHDVLVELERIGAGR